MYLLTFQYYDDMKRQDGVELANVEAVRVSFLCEDGDDVVD